MKQYKVVLYSEDSLSQHKGPQVSRIYNKIVKRHTTKVAMMQILEKYIEVEEIEHHTQAIL